MWKEGGGSEERKMREGGVREKGGRQREGVGKEGGRMREQCWRLSCGGRIDPCFPSGLQPGRDTPCSLADW